MQWKNLHYASIFPWFGSSALKNLQVNEVYFQLRKCEDKKYIYEMGLIAIAVRNSLCAAFFLLLWTSVVKNLNVNEVICYILSKVSSECHVKTFFVKYQVLNKDDVFCLHIKICSEWPKAFSCKCQAFEENTVTTHLVSDPSCQRFNPN